MNGKFMEAFEYLDGHLTTAPFNDDCGLWSLLFQLALQLHHQERRVASKERTLKRIGSTFNSYMSSGGNDALICSMFLYTLQMAGASPEDLRDCLENLVRLCPFHIKFQDQLFVLMLETFRDSRAVVVEKGSNLFETTSSLGLSVDAVILQQANRYYLQCTA